MSIDPVDNPKRMPNIPPPKDMAQMAYELWVHLSDHVVQPCEPDEDGPCEHCKTAEVDCDGCRQVLKDYLDLLERLGDDDDV